MYVIGDFSTKGGGGSGDGSVIIMDGVQVKLFVGGNLAVGGNGIVNNNGRASALSIYGINPTGTNTQTFDFGGTSTFFGTVYASGADIKLAGGANGTYVGSIAGKTVFLNGNTNVRYDASIAGSGLITRFAIASWFEDVKK